MRLNNHGITLDAVLQTVRDATAVGSGGFVDTPNQRLALRHVPAVYTPEQLGEIPIRAAFTQPASNRLIGNALAANGSPLRIRDVAEVMFDYAPPLRRNH